MKKAIFILIAFATGCSVLKAQFDMQLSNFWTATNYFNPALAGENKQLELTALYRMQWIGVTRAPRSTIVAGSLPYNLLGREHGFGLNMYNESIGLFSTNVISGQYAFKTRLFKGALSIGLQGGYITEKFDGSKIEIPENSDFFDPNDEAKPTGEVSGSSIDAALGVSYSRNNLFVGLSVTHLLSPKLELNQQYILDIPRTYYFMAGYNIRLNNPLLELRPTILVKTMELSSYYIEGDSLLVPVSEGNTFKALWSQTQIDVALRLVYARTFWAGLSWRKDDAVVVMLGGKLKMIEIGYSYDMPISKIIKSSWGSHELFLKYTVDLNKKKSSSKNKHKSVRIL